VSREDHKRHDVLLERIRQLEQAIPKGEHSALDRGWFLASVMALALLLLAPKVGRGLTAMVSIAMILLLIQPIWKLGLVQHASSTVRKNGIFVIIMMIAVVFVSVLGAYVWPPIKRHTLTAR
jgi:hypothetical protein